MAACGDGSGQVDGQVGTRRMCQPCENKQITMLADVYCGTCCEYQCKECCKIHQMYMFMNGHKLEQINQRNRTIQIVLPVDMKGVDMCVEHQKQYLSYCVDHDILLCNTCLISNHRKCDEILELDAEPKKTSNAKQANQDITRLLNEIKDSATTMLNDAEKAKYSTGRTLGPILSKIDEKKDLVIQKFEDLNKNVTEEITQCEQEAESDLDDVIATSTETIDRITILKDIHGPVLNHGSTSQKFILEHITGMQAETFQAFKATHNVKPCRFTFEFSPQLIEVLDQENQLGTLQKNTDIGRNIPRTQKTNTDATTSLDSESNRRIDVINQATTTDKVVDNDKQSTTPKVNDDSQLIEPATLRNEPLTLHLIHSIDLKRGPGDRWEPSYTGMDFLPDGRLIVVDNNNHKLCVYDKRLVKINAVDFTEFPNSVAVLSEDDVAVTDGDNKTIQILKISHQSEITLSRIIKTSSRCFSICPMNATTLLVSTYDDERPMRMIKTDGEEEDFANLEQIKYGIYASRSTYVNSADMIALTNRFTDTVYLYKRSGKHLTRQAITHPNIHEPRGVCEGPGHSVFVCSTGGTNFLVQVSTSGDILGSHKLDAIHPSAVCMSKDGRKVAVSNGRLGSKKLQIYYIKY